MPVLSNLQAASQADILSDSVIGGGDTTSVAAIAFKSTVTEGMPFGVSKTVLSSPTVALVQLSVGSTASAPLFDVVGQGFVSCTTILFTTGATAGVGALRVKNGATYYWIPLLPVGSVTAAVRG